MRRVRLQEIWIREDNGERVLATIFMCDCGRVFIVDMDVGDVRIYGPYSSVEEAARAALEWLIQYNKEWLERHREKLQPDDVKLLEWAITKARSYLEDLSSRIKVREVRT